MQNLDIAAIVVLCVVVMALMVKFRRKRRSAQKKKQEAFVSPGLGGNEANHLGDEEILAVRKREELSGELNDTPSYYSEPEEILSSEPFIDDAPIQVLHVMAKEKSSFAGYELLQVLLAVGLRFGQMNIFHYYRQAGVQEEVLFSLVSATEPGTFDIRNMGGFSCVGLTLFMKKVGDEQEDRSRFHLMLQTANQLAEDLDGILLNARKERLHPESKLSSSRFSEPAEAALILEE